MRGSTRGLRLGVTEFLDEVVRCLHGTFVGVFVEVRGGVSHALGLAEP